jgi:hypothetical protein
MKNSPFITRFAKCTFHYSSCPGISKFLVGSVCKICDRANASSPEVITGLFTLGISLEPGIIDFLIIFYKNSNSSDIGVTGCTMSSCIYASEAVIGIE